MPNRKTSEHRPIWLASLILSGFMKRSAAFTHFPLFRLTFLLSPLEESF
ncbi:hypothetical protein NEOC95_001962 [Neochlamydia sp. AcF95]|nr:hypothetical protein [Neochlamydia sp. AcF95]